MPSLHSPFFSLRGACLTMRGGSGPLCTPRSKSSDLASAPIRGRSAPPTPGVYAGLAAPAPTCRRSALHPGDFLPDEKVTKESPRGGHPLWVLPLGGIIIPPAAQALLPPRKGFRHKNRPICHSGLVGKSVFFLPKLYRGSHFPFSIRGTAGMPRGCLRA